MTEEEKYLNTRKRIAEAQKRNWEESRRMRIENEKIGKRRKYPMRKKEGTNEDGKNNIPVRS